ncbi:hypothetical protein N7535_008562 [Penicillium sp. DV-2018c]|nr:hypothetical protein N7461_002321 [Penicillium sp. DV-2018c]KAJ5563398.1 hypothetical protein N7535_008562 [Penicillium sp. DV-2018c]
MKCLPVLQSEQIIHDAQEWLCKLLVGNTGYDAILLNWFACRIEMVSLGMDRQWQAFVVFDDSDGLGFLLGCSSRAAFCDKRSTFLFDLRRMSGGQETRED